LKKKLPIKFEVVSRVKGSEEFSSVITYDRSRYEIKSHLANSKNTFYKNSLPDLLMKIKKKKGCQLPLD
jgi:hypothetical protein